MEAGTSEVSSAEYTESTLVTYRKGKKSSVSSASTAEGLATTHRPTSSHTSRGGGGGGGGGGASKNATLPRLRGECGVRAPLRPRAAAAASPVWAGTESAALAFGPNASSANDGLCRPDGNGWPLLHARPHPPQNRPPALSAPHCGQIASTAESSATPPTLSVVSAEEAQAAPARARAPSTSSEPAAAGASRTALEGLPPHRELECCLQSGKDMAEPTAAPTAFPTVAPPVRSHHAEEDEDPTSAVAGSLPAR
mmetsp:Transcript_14813/g.43755  ORF Transcript_14813/g.43755 Transcript_14813/m.43755 type:complete len:253 (+) Transcript_14813:1333-2091(+)